MSALSAIPLPAADAAGDDDAERAILGACLIDNRLIDQVAAILPDMTDWHQPNHAQIWASIRTLHDQGRPVDPIILADWLASQRNPDTGRGLLDQIGGAIYLADLLSAVTVTANVAEHARIVATAAQNRRLETIGQRLAIAAQTGGSVATIAHQAAEDIQAAVAHTQAKRIATMAAVMDDLLDHLGQPETTGMPTPWPTLNDTIGGLTAGSLTVIGARPGVGKSMVAQALAEHAADQQHTPVLFCSLEMRAREIGIRRIAAKTGLPQNALRRGPLSPAQDELIERAAISLAESPMWILDDAGQTATTIRTAARDLNPGMVVVDYLQLLTPERREQNREREVAEQSRRFKLLAQELDIPVIVLSQLNRSLTTRSDKRPELTDLRESGAIEQDADIVMLLHHPDAEDQSRLVLNVAKNRNGTCGAVSLIQQGWCARIRELDTRPTTTHHRHVDPDEEDQDYDR